MTERAKRAEPVIMTEIVFPQDTNPMGTMFGGAAYALMDKGGVCCGESVFRVDRGDGIERKRRFPYADPAWDDHRGDRDGDSRGVDLDGGADGALLPESGRNGARPGDCWLFH